MCSKLHNVSFYIYLAPIFAIFHHSLLSHTHTQVVVVCRLFQTLLTLHLRTCWFLVHFCFTFILLGKLSSLYPIVYCRKLLHFARETYLSSSLVTFYIVHCTSTPFLVKLKLFYFYRLTFFPSLSHVFLLLLLFITRSNFFFTNLFPCERVSLLI